MCGILRMLSWIRSWWSRPIEQKKEPVYGGPVITIRNIDEQYKINEAWWGTARTLTPLPDKK